MFPMMSVAMHMLSKSQLPSDNGRDCYSTSTSPPALDRLMPLARHVVHVCQQLVPGHGTRRLVGGVGVARARAPFRVCSELLAHVDANGVQFVLELQTVCQVFGNTCFADFRNAVHMHLLLNSRHLPPILDCRMSVA